MPAHPPHARTYTVKPHDTLFSIAAHFGIEPSALLAANPAINRQTHALTAGQSLLIPDPPATPPWLTIALQEPAHGGHGAAYYRAGAGLGGDDWCSIFVNWVVKKAGLRGTGSAAARSWLDWGVALRHPKPGAIAILSDGNYTVRGYEGNPWFHVAIVTAGAATSLEVVGGNQPDVCRKHFGPPKLVEARFRWPAGH